MTSNYFLDISISNTRDSGESYLLILPDDGYDMVLGGTVSGKLMKSIIETKVVKEHATFRPLYDVLTGSIKDREIYDVSTYQFDVSDELLNGHPSLKYGCFIKENTPTCSNLKELLGLE